MSVFEFHAAIERHETSSTRGEVDHQHLPVLASEAVADIALDVINARIRQQRHIEIDRFLSFVLEPEAGCNLRDEFL